MRKSVLILALIITIIGCERNNQKKDASNKINSIENQYVSKLLDSNKIETKKIGDYISDTIDYFWYAKQNDSASYWVRIVFQKEFAVYQFHGQCLYWFFTNHYYTGTDKIELLWSYKTDCLLEMDFLKKSNGIKRYPKQGDAFCEYKLVNDSVIEVKYKFPEWIKKINEMEKDSIFPQYFYLEKEGI